jgi:hypothetical protein
VAEVGIVSQAKIIAGVISTTATTVNNFTNCSVVRMVM